MTEDGPQMGNIALKGVFDRRGRLSFQPDDLLAGPNNSSQAASLTGHADPGIWDLFSKGA
jgi:hypothetical protein